MINEQETPITNTHANQKKSPCWGGGGSGSNATRPLDPVHTRHAPAASPSSGRRTAREGGGGTLGGWVTQTGRGETSQGEEKVRMHSLTTQKGPELKRAAWESGVRELALSVERQARKLRTGYVGCPEPWGSSHFSCVDLLTRGLFVFQRLEQ